MSTKGAQEHIVFHSCPQVTSLLRLLSSRRLDLLNNQPLFHNKASLFRNNLPLLKNKRALSNQNKKDVFIYRSDILAFIQQKSRSIK